ncbi:MAG TPA: GH116 family glycosyl hydrolase, partial [bacterium]|nr:GH116 family glycosyl hydrolase [bacterium]
PGTGAAWYREYTKYYGGTSTGRTGFNSGAIAMDALGNYGAWESSVDSWQSTILTGNYPDWLKQMLFNELYYYFTGGTMWEAGKVGDASFDTKPNMFSSLESYIYDFYGTSDVRFYGSWPLALLWPDIDKQEVKQFCDSVVTGTAMGGLGPLSAATCAHDIGDDNGVFTEWNAYVYRDSTTWKDLNSKLVLMVYRAWELTGKTDSSFLNYCWPAVQAAMTKVHGQCDASGLPISSGIDQTYDDLGLTGDTAYCGSLFLAACEAAQAMATQEGNSALAASYGNWLSTGQASFESLLWDNTGGYYHIDTGSSAPNRIMSDQLCGEWYAKALGLPGIVSDAHADSAWQKVHDDNWLKFDGGAHGVVNVMTSAGAIDTSYPQSQEAWVGVGWSVAAGLVQQGLFTQATDIGYSLYNSIWNTGQLWFRTPEAWQTGLTSVRAPYYMRANAIWALKHAYDIAPPPCGLLTCTATPTLSPTATQTPTATVNPCAFVYQTVDCGGPATVIAGVSWAADQAYTAGGFGYVTAGTAASTGSAIAGSGAQQPLYQTERYAATLEYKFNVPNGLYQVTLKNAEQYYTTTGNRVFSVAINGVTVITNMDLVAQVGAFTADDHTFAVSVTGGLIDIVGTASKDNAEFTAIEVVSEAPCSPTPTPTPTRTATRTPTPSPTVSPTVS